MQDFVAADSLDIVIREYGAAPPADALRVAAQLAGALDFAAAVDVAHGALHPRDVLLSADDTRLTGIGVARALERVGVAAPVRRPYTAPERIAGGDWDRRADVFSLAALIHELLWGRRVGGARRRGGRRADRHSRAATRPRCAPRSRARSPRIRPSGSRPRSSSPRRSDTGVSGTSQRPTAAPRRAMRNRRATTRRRRRCERRAAMCRCRCST